MMKVLILIGSGDANSHSLQLGRHIEEALIAKGATTKLVNLVESDIPLFNRSIERNNSYNPITQQFLNDSATADAYIWVTPIYHNSFSGILKNALDWQHSKFPNKVVGLASHGGHRSPQAVDHLMHIVRAQHGIAARTRVCTEDGDYDEQLAIKEPTIIDRIEAMASEVIELVTKLA